MYSKEELELLAKRIILNVLSEINKNVISEVNSNMQKVLLDIFDIHNLNDKLNEFAENLAIEDAELVFQNLMKTFLAHKIINDENNIDLLNWAKNYYLNVDNKFISFVNEIMPRKNEGFIFDENIINYNDDINNLLPINKVEIKNFNIKDYALENIFQEFNELQKAKLIYNRINEVLIYNPIGIYVETSENNSLNHMLKSRNVDINCLSSTSGVCYDWAKIYSQLLNEIGIENNIIIAPFHGFVIFMIDNKYYFADATKVFEEMTDLARSANNIISSGFFEIDKETYDEFIRLPEEMTPTQQEKFMEKFRTRLLDLDSSIGYNLNSIEAAFEIKKSTLDFHLESLGLTDEATIGEIAEKAIEKYIFPEIMNEDIVAGYTWACELIENIFPTSVASKIRSNMYYNNYTKESSVAFRVEVNNTLKTYFYVEGSNKVELMTSKQIKKAGFSKSL